MRRDAWRSFVGIERPRQEGPFLYSLANLWSLLSYVCEEWGASEVCEIGVQDGVLFDAIVSSTPADRRRLVYYGIDPSISLEARERIESRGGTIIQEPSSVGIGTAPPCAIYLLDGDHNYPTVVSDLEKIASRGGREGGRPLIIVHDVCWPTDRRDAYYLPSCLKESRTYTTKKGLRPDSAELFDDAAIMASDTYCWAEDYGGERNGVLTAVEDFVAASGGEWECAIVPGCFGLGLLHAPESMGERQRRLLATIRDGVGVVGGLIEMLEYNRLDLYCRLQGREQQLRTMRQEMEALKRRLATATHWFDSVKRSLTWRLLGRFTIGRSEPPLNGREECDESRR